MAAVPISRYVQTSWMLDAERTLSLPDLQVRVRRFTEKESADLQDRARRRNVFARHSWENSFYLQRIGDLANRTVIEVSRPGDPDDIIDTAQRLAGLIEKLVILSSTLGLRRINLQRRLAVNVNRRWSFDITIGPGFRYLRSKSRPEQDVRPLAIDDRFRSRFARCGFLDLANLLAGESELGRRLVSAVEWLFESLFEPLASAAVVKTVTALESLLGFSQSEPLARLLAERSAFTLSSDPDLRRSIYQIVKQFYNVRSGVVHGSRKRARKLTTDLLDGMNRLALLLCLIIAANSDEWKSGTSLVEWSDDQRWGRPSSDIMIPFPSSYLTRAVSMASRES